MFYIKNVLYSYPVRDKRLVKKTICPMYGISSGMRPTQYNVAYLRYAMGVGGYFFYQSLIPNGMAMQNINIQFY